MLGGEKMNENKIVEVCGTCFRACCWYGEIMCDESREAGTVKLTIRDLRRLNLEHEENWSDEKMTEIYGDSIPLV